MNSSQTMLGKLQEKREQQRRLEVLVNRLNRLKSIDIQVQSKAEKIKAKVLHEESIKLRKQQMKMEIELKKYKTNELVKLKNSQILQHKSEEKKLREQRHQKKLQEQKEVYLNAISNRKLISKLLEQIDDSEHKLKVYNYQKVSESRNKAKTNSKIETFETEHNRQESNSRKFKAIEGEVEKIKNDIFRLESVEQDAISKINATINLQGMMAKDVRGQIAQILVCKSKPIEKEFQIQKIINKRFEKPSKEKMLIKKKDSTSGLSLLGTNFSLNCSADYNENGMKTQIPNPTKVTKYHSSLPNSKYINAQNIKSKSLTKKKAAPNIKSSQKPQNYSRTRVTSPKNQKVNSNNLKHIESKISEEKINLLLPSSNPKMIHNK